MTIEVINFGCRLNTYEGEVIKKQAEQGGLQNALIFNSCAVTAEAERQVRQAIRKARKENPQAKIIVTGCSAQVHPEDYTAMSEVDHVLGNQDKMQAAPYARFLGADERAQVNDAQSVRETASHLVPGMDARAIVSDIMSARTANAPIVAAFEDRARAFVQVQNGCDHRCTFCIIPFGRGPSRSVPVGDIVTQVRTLVEAGYREVVLTGVDISDYGKDLPGNPSLGQMMKRVLKLVPELPRLRLSSIDAAEVDADTYDLLASEPRLMPHLHISLQAGDDMILKRMKRRHSRADLVRFAEKVRSLRPDVVFGADIIVGFPTETEEMFSNTLALVDEISLTWLHVFPYSARSGTPAARMPQVAKEIRKERAARLRAAGELRINAHLAAQVGKRASVLVEKERSGRTEHFAMVELDTLMGYEQGGIVRAEITGVANGKLLGRLAA